MRNILLFRLILLWFNSAHRSGPVQGAAMGRLTTHVLDTMAGRPAAGLKIELWRLDGNNAATLVKTVKTNSDGRADGPILHGEDFTAGRYEFRFMAGEYLRANGAELPDPPFLDVIPIRFGIADAGGHYHVPLLLSAYGYSTYRGS
jgi:5-hydroxyisourate hydrolase